MANTTFVDSQTPVVAAWLNDVNDLTYSKQFPDGKYAVTSDTPSTSISSDNVSYLPAGTGAVATTVQSKLRECVSVKDFGAVGDGVTDDTASIQAAIDAVEANGGGILFIPVGNYVVSSTLSTTATECPITIQGAGPYTTAKGTAISWKGGNSVSVFDMPGYGRIQDLYIENVNASTSSRGIGYVGTSAVDNRAYAMVSNVVVRGFYIGFILDYAWNIDFYHTQALYCDIGYSIRTESNALTFTGCRAGDCDKGISDASGSGARGIVWTGGSIEGSTTVGIDYATNNVSNSWVFNGVYFENNYRTAVLGKDITISDPFINGDGLGARPAIEIIGSRGITISGVYDAGVTSLVEFSGTDADYVGNSVYVTCKYLPTSIQKSLYDYPDAITYGWLDPACYVQIQTNWLDASSLQTVPVSIAGMNYEFRDKKLIAVKLAVETQVVVSGTATFSFGHFGPSYNQEATRTFNANISAGIYDIPLVSGAATDYFSNVYNYYAVGTAETSGQYAFLLYFD